jgi:hydroxymethylpyrimidine/phosphomethylpyrimidine kinase
MKGWCLTVAGLDPSAGAGVLADVETFAQLGLQGAAIVTAVTAQNRYKVTAVHLLSRTWFRDQADALLDGTLPSAVKVGMLGSRTLVHEVVRLLDRLQGIPVVLDPVFWASAGTALLEESGIDVLKRRLLPRAWVATPNVKEAERLLGRRVRGEQDMVDAAGEIRRLGPKAVIITGGDCPGEPVDVLEDGSSYRIMRNPRVQVANVRGTGCRYSSAIAALLAKDCTVRRAVEDARRFVQRYLETRRSCQDSNSITVSP